jgi:uncharacterized protein
MLRRKIYNLTIGVGAPIERSKCRLKFQPDYLAGVNTITRHDGRSIGVGPLTFTSSVLVPWRGEVLPWPVDRFEALGPAHFESLLQLQPELVILGSGRRLLFPAPALFACLIERRIGLETMDTAAACRTYNVLASEGRTVVAALMIEAAR